MTNVIYVYPWDIVGDPRAPARLRSLGVDSVALAATYHATRAATPLHPAHRLVDARYAACYVPVREEAWKDARLVPAVPAEWTASADPFGEAAAALRAEGLPVHAWTVLTHNSLLGSADPGLVVVNAFGEPYPYALCPASQEVRDYCHTLVGEIVELGEPDGLILEACGALGLRHAGLHEKTDGADWSPVQIALLSLCFCRTCRTRYESAGVDVSELTSRVRAGVDRASGSAPASVEEALGDLAQAVRTLRTGLARELRDPLTARIRSARPGMPLALHADADPWATGSFATVSTSGTVDADLLIGNCWNDPEADMAGLRALRRLGEPNRPDAPYRPAEPGRLGPRIGAYVLALPPRPADGAALSRLAGGYRAAGADEIHWYHGGLVSAARLKAIGQAVRE
ncbi:hypothetical protein ACQP1K_20840 [Sphaerimonospora sp. CA-214678]|uniref:hypothetical protein n=1 Tax=Sphaerimonospora sp. CA-214678 TaxID=3240029 RepID=UPI003D8F5190